MFQTRNESTACIDGKQYQCSKDKAEECVGVEDNEYVYEILKGEYFYVMPRVFFAYSSRYLSQKICGFLWKSS